MSKNKPKLSRADLVNVAGEVRKAINSGKLKDFKFKSEIQSALKKHPEYMPVLEKAAKQLNDEDFAKALSGKFESVSLKLSSKEMEILRAGGRGFWDWVGIIAAGAATGLAAGASLPTAIVTGGATTTCVVVAGGAAEGAYIFYEGATDND